MTKCVCDCARLENLSFRLFLFQTLLHTSFSLSVFNDESTEFWCESWKKWLTFSSHTAKCWNLLTFRFELCAYFLLSILEVQRFQYFSIDKLFANLIEPTYHFQTIHNSIFFLNNKLFFNKTFYFQHNNNYNIPRHNLVSMETI